uniref:ATP-dependent Clp protease proteolytic subunit n=2 Tax=Zea mays TaxID=4577 RepID=A0A804Q321_MAIZE
MALALRCPPAATSSRSPFLPSTSPAPAGKVPRRPPASWRCLAYYGDGGFRKNYDHIPKQFREENLKDGLMDNYKHVPQFLYGLSDAQMEMFMNDDNPYNRQSQKVTEESVSAARSYDEFGMYTLSGMHEGPASYSMGMGMGGSMSMSMGRGGRGYRRMRSSAPDLPSLLLDSRIIFLGMPIVPAVTELIAAQFLWLDYDDRTKPIYLYINSTGTMDENNELVASETDAYAIADFINRSKSKVYTINLSMAYGQAAMLLSLGVKGKRGVLPNSITKLHLPKVHKSGGAAIDMWIKAKELDTNTDYYLELLSKGVGKPKEELAEFLRGPRYFRAQEALDYGLADTILHSLDGSFKPKDLTAQLAKAQAMRQSGKRAAAGAGRWSTPTAPRDACMVGF